MEWTAKEHRVIAEMMNDTGLSEPQLVRQAMRHYQLRLNAAKAGFPEVRFANHLGNIQRAELPPGLPSFEE